MTLLNGKKNSALSFISFDNIIAEQRKKLVELGLVPGEIIKVLRDSRCGFITVLLKDSKIAIDYNTASKILVKEC